MLETGKPGISFTSIFTHSSRREANRRDYYDSLKQPLLCFPD